MNVVYTQGGTELEREYGDVRPWRPPFHTSPVVRKASISSKRVSSQDPLLRKFWNFSLYTTASIFTQILAHKPPNLEIFSSPSPQIRKFSVHKPPFSEANVSSQFHTSEIRAAHPYLKKSSVPPPPPAGALPKNMWWVYAATLTPIFKPPVTEWPFYFHILLSPNDPHFQNALSINDPLF